MIDRMGEAFARLMSERVSRRSVIARCGKMLAVVVAGPALARALGTGEAVDTLSNEVASSSQPSGEVGPLHYSGHCDLCYYCGIWGVPCSHCGATSDDSPCPKGQAMGAWWVCCPCPTRNFLMQYQDCCCNGPCQCNGTFCDRNEYAFPQKKRTYGPSGGVERCSPGTYYCTRVVWIGDCTSAFQKWCPGSCA